MRGGECQAGWSWPCCGVRGVGAAVGGHNEGWRRTVGSEMCQHMWELMVEVSVASTAEPRCKGSRPEMIERRLTPRSGWRELPPPRVPTPELRSGPVGLLLLACCLRCLLSSSAALDSFSLLIALSRCSTAERDATCSGARPCNRGRLPLVGTPCRSSIARSDRPPPPPPPLSPWLPSIDRVCCHHPTMLYRPPSTASSVSRLVRSFAASCFSRRNRAPLLLLLFGLSCLMLAAYLLASYSWADSKVAWNDVPPQPLTAAVPPLHVIGVRGADEAEKERQRVEEEEEEARLAAPAALTDASPDALSPIPVIIFTFDRADNLRRTIDSVLSALPATSSLHPIFISQDGDHPAVEAVVASYGQRVSHLKYVWKGTPRAEYRTAYLKIAGHYQFALSEVMDRVDGHERWDRVIMLEDDMDVSPDFFSYFRRMSPLLDSDPTLYCVSAWNDNGQSSFVASPTAAYRTECFPGLGWMWSRGRWEELHEWTWGFWDDWLREPAQRKGRSCIFPEINRAYTFGSVGTSAGQFFDQYLKHIRLNTDNVDWQAVDVSYLQQPQYESWLMERLKAAVRAGGAEEAKAAIDGELDSGGKAAVEVSERRFGYRSLEQLTALITPIGLIPDHKAGVPRASYKGVLHFRHREVRIWIVPDSLGLPLG